MKYVTYSVIFIFILFSITQATGERGLKRIKIIDQSGQEIGLYEESHALIIGINDYTEGWSDLPGVKEDMKAVKSALEKNGFHVEVKENLDRSELDQAFTIFINRHGQKPDNRLLFYFAGHGHTHRQAYGGEMGYIVPADAPNPDVDAIGFLTKAMDMEMFNVYAKRIQSKHALFMFDSCFSGSIFALTRAAPTSITYKTTEAVRQFITSGSADERVPDKSIFRQQFLAALNGEGDMNGDNYVTGEELGYFLENTVVNYSKGTQHPQYGKIRHTYLDKGDFVFTITPQVVTLTITSNVNNSTVFIDGKKYKYGSTPLEVALPLKQSIVRIEKNGYRTFEKEIDLKTAQTLHCTLQPEESSLAPKARLVVQTRYRNASQGTVAFSPDGHIIASDGIDGSIILWDIYRGKVMHTLIGDTDIVRSIAFSPNGRLLASDRDNSIKLWDLDTRDEVRTLKGHTKQVASIAFSMNGHLLASSSDDYTIKLWDIDIGKELSTLEGHTGEVVSVAFSSDDRILVSSSKDNTIKLWDVRTGRELMTLPGLFPIAFSPDAHLLASGRKDSAIKLWDLSTIKEFQTLIGHADAIKSVAFSPDGQSIVSGSADNTVKLWDVHTGTELRTFTGHLRSVSTVAFSPDGQIIISGSLDNTIKLWNLKTGKEIARLISIYDKSDPYPKSDWVVIAPNSQFDASPKAMEHMHWVVDLEPIDLRQLKERYYEPGLLPKLLGYNKEPLRDVLPFESIKLYPKFEWLDRDRSNPAATLRLTNQGGGIGKIAVFINGKEIMDDARNRGTDPDAEEMELTIDVSGHPYLIPGQENHIEVKAWNAEGYLVSRGLRRIYESPLPQIKSPHFWAIVVGISDYQGEELDLRFAAKDAEDMAQALQIGAKRLFGAEKVHLTLLTSPEPTPSPFQEENPSSSDFSYQGRGIMLPTRNNLIQAFEAAKAAKSMDILVVYLTGHGGTHGGQDGDYYYLTAEARTGNLEDPAIRAQTAISSRELTDFIKAIPALKQVLILDTAGSGRVVDNLARYREIPASQIRALDRMKDRTGLHILAGSAADAVSYEASRYSQGILTYSLLLGMKGAALREEEFIDISRLFEFAADKVPELAQNIGGIQRPILAAPYGGASFDIGRMTSEDKSQISLSMKRPVVLRANFLDEENFRDSLGFTKRINDALRELSARGRQAPLVFIDTPEFPDAYLLAGRYRIEGNTVSITINLFYGEQKISQFTVSGDSTDLEQLTAEILKEMEGKI